MTPTDLRQWRKELRLSRKAAAEALGMSERALAYYEAGTRDGKPQEPPQWLAYACAAIYHRLPPWPSQP